MYDNLIKNNFNLPQKRNHRVSLSADRVFATRVTIIKILGNRISPGARIVMRR